MAEYITREEAIAAAKHAWAKGLEPSQHIEALPAADVVPVVRCKDCKHRVYKYVDEEIGEIGGCGLFNRAMSNDDFCSHGKRKEATDG